MLGACIFPGVVQNSSSSNGTATKSLETNGFLTLVVSINFPVTPGQQPNKTEVQGRSYSTGYQNLIIELQALLLEGLSSSKVHEA